jgi:hypothetical protein
LKSIELLSSSGISAGVIDALNAHWRNLETIQDDEKEFLWHGTPQRFI